ncbi:DUF6965 family protein [Sphingobacterium wenxiniae]|uniref:DUF6965 domain-containing protein n=1 Tax=Sphingobacterium wenxiniae TaxID=683125 RepID=A0A1I6NS26_9SPHI|nr:hypothetical protein [Sphingobacterium wenxiniae]SFS30708.1 hypothetical protein SAMN05660206_10149 [Sphingobacterium wenxiniae]
MTIDELKQALLTTGKTYTLPIKLSIDQTLTENVDQFLKVQFIEAEAWKKELSKCPAYLRLLKFYEATR